MTWKNILLPILMVILSAVMIFVLYGSQHTIMNTIEAIALAMGVVGSSKLREGGHKEISYYLISSAFIWSAICVLLLLVFKNPMWNHFNLLTYGFFVILATQFPVALYLNRNRNKSTSQQTSAHES